MRIKVALIQMSVTGVVTRNMDKAVMLLEESAKVGADIACLPELFICPYFPSELGAEVPFSDAVPGPLVARLAEYARRLGVAIVAGSIPEYSGGYLYNTSFVIDADGRYLGKYRKTHIPDDECFWEAHYFKPGDLGYQVFETRVCKLSTLICFDQWFPEPARIAALSGAEILFYPSAIGHVSGISEEEGDWEEAWEVVHRGHAVSSAIPVAAVNRVGREGRVEFWGRSLLIDAFGRVVVRADEDEGVFVGSIDLEHGPRIREGWGFFSRRRPETYGVLLS